MLIVLIIIGLCCLVWLTFGLGNFVYELSRNGFPTSLKEGKHCLGVLGLCLKLGPILTRAYFRGEV